MPANTSLGEIVLNILSITLLTAHLQHSNLSETVQAAVDEAAVPFMDNGKTACMSVGVVKDGQAFTYNFGITARGKGAKPTSQTGYFIGSITKTFTGLLLAKAVSEGKASLDDDVRKFLPGTFPNLEYGGEPIRLWELINHTSGLPMNLPEWQYDQNADFAKTVTTEQALYDRYGESDFLRDLHAFNLSRVPGVKFSYSNAAAQLLGLVLERIYTTSFDKLLQAKITGPLGMRATKSQLSASELSRLPRAYSASGAFIPARRVRFPAAGYLVSTTSDMLKYVAWNMAEKDASVRMTHQRIGTTVWDPNGNFYVGLNWQVLKTPAGRVIFQDGSLPGFHSMCVMVPELHIGMVVLTSQNALPKEAPLSPFIEKVLKAIDPRVPSIP